MQLSVSGPGLDCAEVAETLRACGLQGDVTPNLTVRPGGGAVEPGCRLLLPDRGAWREAWPALRDRFGLGCAHALPLPAAGGGCVLDLFRQEAPEAARGQSAPPGPKRCST